MEFAGTKMHRDEWTGLWMPDAVVYHGFQVPTDLLEPTIKREHLKEIFLWTDGQPDELRARCGSLALGFKLTVDTLEIYKPFETTSFWTGPDPYLLNRPEQRPLSMGDLVAAYNRFVPRVEHDNLLEWLTNSTGVRKRGWFDGFAEYARLDAERRAEQLLMSHLDEEQRAQWNDNSTFLVCGSADGVYELDSWDVRRVSDDHHFCIQIVGEDTPADDAVLMRKLMIENNEPEFLRIANDLDAEPEPPTYIPVASETMRMLDTITQRYLSPLIGDALFPPFRLGTR